MSDSNTLAITGGTPISNEPLKCPHWPPTVQATADRLAEVYMSRQWSFNSPSELEFAQAFADYHGAKHGIFMANGTVTLQCALKACGVGPGDEVIVPALTWMATALAAHYVGAIPVFVDVELDTLCLDPKLVEQAITEKTKAIIPVHLYGSTADLEAINAIAKKHDLRVIEDCAHMHGGTWNGRGVGSWGDVGSFSFQQSKTMASGEGGICITNDDDLAETIHRLKHIGYAAGMAQGEASTDTGPPMGLTCYNFRATAFQAVILHDQLKELKSLIERYEVNAVRLQKRLADVPGIRIQTRGRLSDPQGYYGLIILFDHESVASVPVKTLLKAIAAEGLNLGGTYGPVAEHALFSIKPQNYRIAEGGYPVAKKIGTDRALTLPHPYLGGDDQLIDTIGDILAKVTQNANTLLECPVS